MKRPSSPMCTESCAPADCCSPPNRPDVGVRRAQIPFRDNDVSLAPNPRTRLYTTGSMYVRALTEIATGAAWRGDDVRRLEEAVAARVGVPHAVAVPMARVGIYLAV